MLNFFNKNGRSKDFQFKESENTACFVCDHVVNRLRPILYATHEPEDGTWQFLCGQNDHGNSNIKIISLKQATQIDASINELYEMPIGVGADRKSKNDKWEPFTLTREQ